MLFKKLVALGAMKWPLGWRQASRPAIDLKV